MALEAYPNMQLAINVKLGPCTMEGVLSPDAQLASKDDYQTYT